MSQLGKTLVKGLTDLRDQLASGTLPPSTLVVNLPIRTKAEGNANENKWSRIGRAKKQRQQTAACFAGKPLPPLPVRVEFNRLSPATMDDDNLPSSMKHIRDEIAKLYGCGDSERDPIKWRYRQERVKRGTFGVVVRIQPLATDERKAV